jgi:hypothetical protein
LTGLATTPLAVGVGVDVGKRVAVGGASVKVGVAVLVDVGLGVEVHVAVTVPVGRRVAVTVGDDVAVITLEEMVVVIVCVIVLRTGPTGRRVGEGVGSASADGGKPARPMVTTSTRPKVSSVGLFTAAL